MWDFAKQKVYNVAAPAFDEDAQPGWWISPAAAATAEDEPLLFLAFPPLLARPSAPVSEVVDNSPEEDIPADADSALPPADQVPTSPPASLAAAVQAAMPPTVPQPVPSAHLGLRRNNREYQGVPPQRMADMLMAATLKTSDMDPNTYKKAMKLLDSAKWLEACAAKVASLVDNRVFEIIDRHVSKLVISSKWVFKKKKGLSEAVEKYKARVVAKGFMQEKYLGGLLLKFQIHSSRSISTPLPVACKLSQEDSPQTAAEKEQMTLIPYRSAIGSLMYLAVCTQPDIAAAVCSLSHFDANPGRAYWEGVQHVLRYVKGTSGEGLCFKKAVSTKFGGIAMLFTLPAQTLAALVHHSSFFRLGEPDKWELTC